MISILEMIYNEAGQMTQRANARGITEAWTYDAAGRPTVVAYSNGSATEQSVIYGYQDGQLVSAARPESSVLLRPAIMPDPHGLRSQLILDM